MPWCWASWLGILGFFGIETTSFAALLTSAVLAIIAVWSGMSGDFAASAFMRVLRPIKMGDFVCVGGVTGTGHELGLFGTTPVTPDKVRMLVANSKVFGDNIVNYLTRTARHKERAAQLHGSVDPPVANKMLKVAIAKIPNVVASPAPEVDLMDINLMGTVIAVRPWPAPMPAQLMKTQAA